VDGFGGNLVDSLGVCQGRIDLILVKIRIWIRELCNFYSDSSPLRDRAKNDIILYSKIFQNCIGPDMFSWIRYYVAEVCTLPSARSSYCIICVAYFYLWRFSCMGHSTFVSFNMLLNSVISWENIGFIELDLPTEKINLFGIWV